MDSERLTFDGKLQYSDGKVSVFLHPVKGRCVVANQDIRKGELILINPVELVGFSDIKSKCALDSYPIWWSKTKDCIAFGLINMVNHSKHPNVCFKRRRKERLILCYAEANS